MKRLNLPLALDTLFTGACAFFVFYTAVRYYTKSAAVGLAFGITAAVLFGALAYVYISRKQNVKLLLSRDERDKKLLSLHPSLSSDGYIRRLFKNLLGEGAKISGRKVVQGDTACFFCFRLQPLNEDDVAAVIKYRYDGKKKIYCVSATHGAAELAESFAISVTGIDGVYSALKEKNLLPEKYVYGGAKKAGTLQRVAARFNSKLAAPLFWSGTALLALSYFTFYPIYYIASGSLLLILAAAALFRGQR